MTTSGEGSLPARTTRPISWVKAALKAFGKFPVEAQEEISEALTMAADGRKAEFAKPMHGLGPGVFEVALVHRGGAFRTVYAVQIGTDLWVVHAFQKKSTRGARTPRHEIELIRQRLTRIKEGLA